MTGEGFFIRMWWLPFLFWMLPALAFILAIFAILRHSWKWLLIGTACCSIPVLYLAATPRFYWTPIVPIVYLSTALFVRFNRMRTAWMLLGVTILLTGWIAVLIYTSVRWS